MKLRAIAIVLPLTLLAPAVVAQEDFYAGKRINLNIGFPPGGGVDTYGRILVRHLARHVPGNPTVVAQNMPGAAGVTALKAMETTQAKDGTVLTTFTPNLVVLSIMSPQQVDIDFSSMKWVGSIGQDRRLCYTWHSAGITSWDQLMKRPQVIMGDTGGDWPQREVQRLFNAPIKIVLGYPGSAEKRLAMQRGELDGDCGNLSNLPPDWLSENKINILLRFQQNSEGLPASAIHARTLLTDPVKLQIFDLLNAAADTGRPFVMSKDVPQARVEILRKAFQATVEDVEFQKDIAQARLEGSPTSGAELEARMKALYAMPPNIMEQTRKLLND